MFCDLTSDLSWRMFLVCLRKMYTLRLLGTVLFLGPVSLWYCPSPLFLCWSLNGWSINYWKRGIKIYTIMVLLSISHISYPTICCIYLGTLLLGAYLFITMPSLLIDFFFNHHIILSLVTIFDLNLFYPIYVWQLLISSCYHFHGILSSILSHPVYVCPYISSVSLVDSIELYFVLVF